MCCWRSGSQPSCITGVLNWVHGTYDLLPNGSIVMTPMGDGFQQIQDPCAATSNFVEDYNDTELYQSWRIFTDPTFGFKLHLFMFDGTPVPPQYLISASPQMLPTTLLRNVSTVFTSQDGFVSTGSKQELSASGALSQRWTGVVGATTLVSVVAGGVVMVLLAL